MRAPGQGSIKRCDVTREGSPIYLGKRRIIVAFDEEMFATLRDRALKQQTSFAEQVRILVERGLAE